MRSYYVLDAPGRFDSTPATAGPWGPHSQHGGPPAALLARAATELDPRRTVGRFTMELLGPVPVGPVAVRAAVVRPGRTVSMVEATLTDVARGRACARATAWLFPTTQDGPGAGDGAAPARSPADLVAADPPAAWSSGYLDSVEWRWVEGGFDEPGPGTVWMRPSVPLVEGERTSPLQRLLTCVDSASGISSVLPLDQWRFLNTELTVHVLREPVGDWVCVDATTTLGGGSVGLATSDVYDEQGLVARSAQALLVTRR